MKFSDKIKKRLDKILTTSAIGEERLKKQRKPTPEHLQKAIGEILACIALLSDQVEKLIDYEDKEWKQKDPEWHSYEEDQ